MIVAPNRRSVPPRRSVTMTAANSMGVIDPTDGPDPSPTGDVLAVDRADEAGTWDGAVARAIDDGLSTGVIEQDDEVTASTDAPGPGPGQVEQPEDNPEALIAAIRQLRRRMDED